MFRKSLAIPAAVIAVLSGGAAGFGQWTGPAHAARTAADYSGSISITDYQVPNSLGAGGAGSAQANQTLITAVTDGLLGLDNHGNFFADMVTAVPSTANGGIKVVNGNEVITVHLKPNLKWSDGSPITNTDWISSFALTYAPDIATAPGTPNDQVTSITLNGDTMVFMFQGTLGSALQQVVAVEAPLQLEYMEKKYNAPISGFDFSAYNRAKEVDAKSDLIPAGIYKSSGMQKFANGFLSDNYNSPNDIFDGPYKIGQWSPDQRYVLVPNTFYTALPADANHPRPAKIQEVVLSENGATYIQDLKAGSTYNTIDEAFDFTPDNITDLRQTKYQVVAQPGLSYELLDFMVGPTFAGKPNPLHDVRVRQALNYAIDKYRYLKAVFPAFDPRQLALASPIPGASPWSINSQLPQNEYNPAKAMQLLKAAGFPTSLSDPNHLVLDFATTTKSSRLKGAQIFQRFFNQIGIQIRIRYLPAVGQNGLFSSWADGGVLDHHQYQISLHGFNTNPDPDEGSLNDLPGQINSPTCPNCANTGEINDSKLTSLYLQGRTTLDQATRQKIYAQVQQYYYQQMFNISLYTNPIITLVKGTIGNFKPNVTQVGNLWNASQWWYDASNSRKAILN